MRILVQAECSSVGECGIITENIAQGETTLAKKKPLKKDRKAGRGNLPAQKQPFYLQAQQQRKPKPKKQREDWDFLADKSDFAAMNKAWDAWVVAGHAPVRCTVEATLMNPQYKVEIKIIAAV